MKTKHILLMVMLASLGACERLSDEACGLAIGHAEDMHGTVLDGEFVPIFSGRELTDPLHQFIKETIGQHWLMKDEHFFGLLKDGSFVEVKDCRVSVSRVSQGMPDFFSNYESLKTTRDITATTPVSIRHFRRGQWSDWRVYDQCIFRYQVHEDTGRYGSSRITKLSVRALEEADLQLIDKLREAREGTRKVDREKQPAEWARAMLALGETCKELGGRVRGDEAALLLLDAYEASASALKSYKRDAHPREFAFSTAAMGEALLYIAEADFTDFKELGQSSGPLLNGPDGEFHEVDLNFSFGFENYGDTKTHRRMLERAMRFFQQSLEVFTETKETRPCGILERHMGDCLMNIAARCSHQFEDADALSLQACQHLREAVKSFNQPNLRQDWLSANLRLAFALARAKRRDEVIKVVEELQAAYNTKQTDLEFQGYIKELKSGVVPKVFRPRPPRDRTRFMLMNPGAFAREEIQARLRALADEEASASNQ